MAASSSVRRYNLIATALLAGAAIIAVGVWFLLGEPRSMMQVSAQTRSLAYTVTNPNVAAIAFPGEALLQPGPGRPADCLAGTLSPAMGTRVDYAIVGGNILRIVLTGETGAALATFVDAAGQTHALEPGASLAFGTGLRCAVPEGMVRLPVWGDARIGELPRAVSSAPGRVDVGPILLDGRIDVFGVSRRTTASGQPNLYPAGSFTVSAGSAIEALAGERADATAMRGFALFDPRDSMGRTGQLDARLTTDADRLVLRRWGSESGGEVIEVDLMAQLFGDPALLRLQALLAMLILALTSVAAILQVFTPSGGAE